ncbi:hypothetical protein A2548_04515 [candidate division WOR-1 bacterium RIFOXYD2_FULL_41_8]|nr:MAG: hypothetical protein A2548_04515 [candidate division WOR-1 bacterium RIFOXYD2_FULL_41_8]
MFKPRYTITEKLLANIKHISALVTELNSQNLPKLVVMALTKEARELSTFASTSIEGNPLPLTEVKRILKNRPENLRDTEREVINYNQALKDLGALLQKGNIKLSLKLILTIHQTITKELIEKYRCGHLRQEAVFVNNPGSRQTIYWPPDHQDVKSLLEDLLAFININRTKIDPLILAGIFHKQFVIVHPFMDGNGRTTRLAAKALLAAMGLNTFNLFSFENYYNQNVGKYFEQVGILGNYYDEKDKVDFTRWLEYFTGGIIDELLRVKKELETATPTPETALKPYHQQILGHIKDHGYVTDRDYSLITKRAKATRNHDFNKLLSLGLIEKSGKGKATYYKLKTAN